MTTTFAPPTGPPAGSPLPDVDTSPAASGHRRRPIVLGFAVFALLALGIGSLVAFASGRSSNDATLATAVPFSLAAAAEDAIDARTVHFDLAVSAGGIGDVTVSGAIDNESKLVSVTTDLSSLLALGDSSLPLGNGEMQVLVDTKNGVAYLSSDALGGLVPSGASWVSIDLGAIAKMSGQDIGDLGSQFALDPAETAKLLLDADGIGNAVVVGDEQIDGVATKHYQVTVDLAAALAAAPQADVPAGADLPDTVVYDVWVTADNQLRRASFDTQISGQQVALTLDLTTSADPLGIDVPSGADVFDLTGLLGGS